MIRQAKEKLTAAKVRKLPEGTRVILHGRDRRGYSTELPCTVAKSYRSKVLHYLEFDGTTVTKPIRDYPNKYYTREDRS